MHVILTTTQTSPGSAVGARALSEISLSAKIGAGSLVVSSRSPISSHTAVRAVAFRDQSHP